ncbi:MAG TPA: tetratricopeptide repeat protein [Candidatus Ozemobacteraceae bacterium]|nr:tetratricopeptide repeat protein [Candidatus Ozemobacteraceae bacterium]
MRKGVTLGLFVFLAMSGLTGHAQTGDGPRIDPTLAKVKDHLRAKQPEMAVELLQKELKRQPNNAQFLYALGYSHEIAREPQKALEAFRKAYRLNPTFPGLSLRIKKLEAALEDAGEAAADEKNLSEAQRKARALFRTALKEKGLGNFDKAFALFADCVELDIGYLGGNDRGIIETALNHFAARKMDAKDENARLFHAIYRFFRGDREAATQDLKAFLATQPARENAEAASRWLRIIDHQQKTESEMIATIREEQTVKPIEPGRPSRQTTSNVPTTAPASSAPISDDSAAPVPRQAMTSEEVKTNPRYARYVEEIAGGDTSKAAAAAYNIGSLRISSPEAIQGLVTSLGSDNRILKATAMEALGRIGAPAADAVPAVVGWVQSDTPWMQNLGLMALGKIAAQPQIAVPAAIKCLSSQNVMISNNARQALVKFGKDALPHLTEAMTSAPEADKPLFALVIRAIETGY